MKGFGTGFFLFYLRSFPELPKMTERVPLYKREMFNDKAFVSVFFRLPNPGFSC
jgi:hypothetical protein